METRIIVVPGPWMPGESASHKQTRLLGVVEAVHACMLGDRDLAVLALEF